MRIILITILVAVSKVAFALDQAPDGDVKQMECRSAENWEVLESSVKTTFSPKSDDLGVLKISLPVKVGKLHFESLSISESKGDDIAFIVPVLVKTKGASVIALMHVTPDQSKVSTYSAAYDILGSITPCRLNYDVKVEI